MRLFAYAVVALAGAAVVYETFLMRPAPLVVLAAVLTAGPAGAWLADHPRRG